MQAGEVARRGFEKDFFYRLVKVIRHMSTPLEKGTSLELAVHAIEASILRSSPSYQENTFRMEMKKIVTVEGVRHEIDIWVAVDLGGGYEALFIFESKNWAEKVGKNEIIIFSEKIKAVQAQRGFFVARSFTGDAEAQARHDHRITLLRVADLPLEDIPMPFGFHGINMETFNAEITFVAPGADEHSPRVSVDLKADTIVIEGEPLPLEAYINDWVGAERDKRVNSFPSLAAEDGVHDLPFEAQRTFAPGTARLQNTAVDKILLRGSVRVRVVRAKIISHFEVATRGRALTQHR